MITYAYCTIPRTKRINDGTSRTISASIHNTAKAKKIHVNTSTALILPEFPILLNNRAANNQRKKSRAIS